MADTGVEAHRDPPVEVALAPCRRVLQAGLRTCGWGDGAPNGAPREQRLPMREHSGFGLLVYPLTVAGAVPALPRLKGLAHRLPVSTLGRMPSGYLKPGH